jgi:hypothetical protein
MSGEPAPGCRRLSVVVGGCRWLSVLSGGPGTAAGAGRRGRSVTLHHKVRLCFFLTKATQWIILGIYERLPPARAMTVLAPERINFSRKEKQ